MHESSLARAALPGGAMVLGIPLRPYSVGHELLLISDFGFEFPDLSRLAAAVWICASRWSELKKARGFWSGIKLSLFRRRIRRSLGEGGEVFFQEELRKFMKYLEEGRLEFPLNDCSRPGTKSARPAGAPFCLRLHQFLIGLGLEEEAA